VLINKTATTTDLLPNTARCGQLNNLSRKNQYHQASTSQASRVISNGGLLYAEDLVQETPASGNGRAEDLVQETPASSTVRKTRGTTLMQRIWSLPPNLKIECGLNVRGQQIGESGQTFKRWLGTFCLSRALCPLVPVAWMRVPHKNKEDSWIEIEKRWIIDPEIIHSANQMNWAMHLLGELQRNRRTKLKKKCYPKDALKEEVIEKKPDWADTQDYAVLVDYWFDPNTQTLVNTNKRSRGFQKDIARSGPISFAQTVDNMIGQGTYSTVYRARDLETNRLVALKKYFTTKPLPCDPSTLMSGFETRKLEVYEFSNKRLNVQGQVKMYELDYLGLKRTYCLALFCQAFGCYEGVAHPCLSRFSMCLDNLVCFGGLKDHYGVTFY
ncbi:hypothetical protein SO802_035204, partial [Lithocarpus litseifolius]